MSSVERSTCPALRRVGRRAPGVLRRVRCPPPGARALRPAADRDALAAAPRRSGSRSIACAGAATAIALASERGGTERVLTATGGSVTAPHARGGATLEARRLAARRRPAGRSCSPPCRRSRDATRPSRSRQRARHAPAAAGRRARLVAVRKPPSRLLDDLQRPVPERGRRDGIAPARPRRGQGRPRPADRAVAARCRRHSDTCLAPDVRLILSMEQRL